MQTTYEAKLLSVQITKVDRNVYAKCFFALEPDSQSEALSSVVTLNIAEENADSIFNYVHSNGIQFADKVRIYAKAVRGSQNTMKNIVERIEVITQPKPQAQTQAQAAKV